MGRGITLPSAVLALAVLFPGAVESQVVISDTSIEIGGEEVLTTADAAFLYVRGTGENNPANRVVQLAGDVLVFDGNRGLTLTVLDAASQTEVSSTNYDTWASSTASDDLAVALDVMNHGQIGILTSSDAFERAITPDLRAAAFQLGLLRLAATPSVPDTAERRHPYAAIFYGSGAAAGPSPQVVEIVQSNAANAPHAILVTWLIGDGFVGQGYPPVTPPPRYVDRGDGTVWDSKLNLLFLADPDCEGLPPNTWDVAVAGAAALKDGACGLTDGSSAGDWRLATKAEWELAIADAVAFGCTTWGLATEPSLTNDPGVNCQSAGPSSLVDVQSCGYTCGYWTATEAPTNNVWSVDLSDGSLSPVANTADRYFWAVRDP